MPKVQQTGQKQGEMGNLSSRRESYLSFSILSSLKKTVSQGNPNPERVRVQMLTLPGKDLCMLELVHLVTPHRQ